MTGTNCICNCMDCVHGMRKRIAELESHSCSGLNSREVIEALKAERKKAYLECAEIADGLIYAGRVAMAIREAVEKL